MYFAYSQITYERNLNQEKTTQHQALSKTILFGHSYAFSKMLFEIFVIFTYQRGISKNSEPNV